MHYPVALILGSSGCLGVVGRVVHLPQEGLALKLHVLLEQEFGESGRHQKCKVLRLPSHGGLANSLA